MLARASFPYTGSRGTACQFLPETGTYSPFGTPLNTQHFLHFIIHILVLVLYLHMRTWTKKNNAVVILIADNYVYAAAGFQI
jgi:hypothetical protein